SAGVLILSRSPAISRATVANVTRDRRQIVHRAADHSSVLLGILKQVGGPFSGCVDADERRIGKLALCGILSRGLTKLLGRALAVREVVNDLKRKADRLAVVAQRVEFRLSGAGQQPAEHDRGGDQLRGLVAVDELQPLE